MWKLRKALGHSESRQRAKGEVFSRRTINKRLREGAPGPGEVELASTIKQLLTEIERVGPERLVIDSLSEFRLLAQDPLRYRRQLLALKQFFVGRNTTVLLLDDHSPDGGEDQQVLSVVHGVIRLTRV